MPEQTCQFAAIMIARLILIPTRDIWACLPDQALTWQADLKPGKGDFNY